MARTGNHRRRDGRGWGRENRSDLAPAGRASPWLSAFLLLALLLTACSLPTPTAGPTVRPSAVPPTPMPTARGSVVVPTASALPSTPPLTPTPSPVPEDLHLSATAIQFHPDPQLYAGDLVTIDITPQNVGAIAHGAIAVNVTHHGEEEKPFAEERVNFYGFDGVPRIRLTWAWDTTGLVGDQTLVFHLDPEDEIQEGDEDPANNVLTLTVPILPVYERHPVEIGAVWAMTETQCCVLHYLTGSSAERDLPEVRAMSERAVNWAEERLGTQIEEQLQIYLIGRVIGHGGYAYRALALSYLDRHYAGFDIETGIRHEATHVLDAQFLTRRAPALLREGLAVWVAGGHFKPEPIPQRAAALLELESYIPLPELGDAFYQQQHEIGYLEGAAFVDYLVERYGWNRFLAFYESFESIDEGSQTEDLEQGLLQAFDVDLETTEAAFTAWLESQELSPDHVQDVEYTVLLFDTIRRYQQAYDPSAYFRSGWLVNPVVAEDREIVADLLRHPRSAEHVALETLLIAAHQSLLRGEFDRTAALLNGVNRVLDDGVFVQSPESDYLAIVEELAAAGYEAQQIELDDRQAYVEAIAQWPILETLVVQHTAAGWVVGD